LKKILFTGGGGAGNEAIFRILSDDYEMHFADADLSAISPLIPEEFRHEIPYAVSSDFIDNINTLCSKYKIDLVIPGVDEELTKINKLNTPSMLPDTNYVKTMLDKLKSAHTITKANLDSPRTITISDFLNGEEIIFPCIAKPRNGRGSRNVNILNTPDQVSAYLILTGILADEAVLQELCIGQEYTVLMSSDSRASLRAVVPVRVAVKKGITLRAETEDNSAIINACVAIHDALPAKGCYNIQLILTDDGRVMPFEINPRISTTFCLGLAAGINPIDNYLSDNTTTNKLQNYHSSLALFRSWSNYFKY